MNTVYTVIFMLVLYVCIISVIDYSMISDQLIIIGRKIYSLIENIIIIDPYFYHSTFLYYIILL